MSVLLGTRPRASIQHSGQIDDSTHSTTIARSSFVIRTLTRSPWTMRTITPQSTAAVSTACSASLGRSSGISDAAIDAADERLGGEECVRGIHGPLRHEHEERPEEDRERDQEHDEADDDGGQPEGQQHDHRERDDNGAVVARRGLVERFGLHAEPSVPGTAATRADPKRKPGGSSGAPRNDCNAT